MSSTSFEGANLGLLVATAVALAVGGAIVLGPGRSLLEDARSRYAQQLDRFESWRSRLTGFRRPDETEQSRLGDLWNEVLAHTRPAADPSAIVAQATEDFQGTGVRNLRVRPVALGSGVEIETHELHSPVDQRSLSVTAAPISVEFSADPESALRILRRLDTGDLPARLDTIELRRALPVIDVQMDLEYFVRQEGAP